MYAAYYGFREKPFALTPDPRYLFLSATHREVLGHLVYGIEQGEGFMAISGEVGTGKTTLCRTLLDRMGASCEIAFLFNPTLSPLELIQAINAELGLAHEADSRTALLDVLNAFLLAKHDEGRRVLVIIDEAQDLPLETLEQLRLLSNLESRTSKLLQIVLIGQPELDENLATRELRQLRQRISVWWSLGPLRRSETAEYVQHRLRIASGADRPIFTRAALARVHALTSGVPRLINVLCDRCLLAGYGDQTAQIDAGTVRRVARELRLGRRPAWLPSPAVVAIACGIFVAAIASAVLLRTAPEPPPLARPAAAEVSAPPPAPPPPPAEPAPSPTPEPTPFAEPPPAPEPDTRAALDDLFSLREPSQNTSDTLSALLDAWGLAESDVRAASFPSLLDQLEARGMRSLALSSLSRMRELDLPTVVRLAGEDGGERVALVRSLSDEAADLEGLMPGQLVRVALAELEQRWLRPGYAIWRDPQRLPSLLAEGATGPSVLWLESLLRELGFDAGQPDDSFDARTRVAVEEFQRDQGLVADGQVGPVTQTRLYRARPEHRVPALVVERSDRTASAS